MSLKGQDHSDFEVRAYWYIVQVLTGAIYIYMLLLNISRKSCLWGVQICHQVDLGRPLKVKFKVIHIWNSHNWKRSKSQGTCYYWLFKWEALWEFSFALWGIQLCNLKRPWNVRYLMLASNNRNYPYRRLSQWYLCSYYLWCSLQFAGE